MIFIGARDFILCCNGDWEFQIAGLTADLMEVSYRQFESFIHRLCGNTMDSHILNLQYLCTLRIFNPGWSCSTSLDCVNCRLSLSFSSASIHRLFILFYRVYVGAKIAPNRYDSKRKACGTSFCRLYDFSVRHDCHFIPAHVTNEKLIFKYKSVMQDQHMIF